MHAASSMRMCCLPCNLIPAAELFVCSSQACFAERPLPVPTWNPTQPHLPEGPALPPPHHPKPQRSCPTLEHQAAPPQRLPLLPAAGPKGAAGRLQRRGCTVQGSERPREECVCCAACTSFISTAVICYARTPVRGYQLLRSRPPLSSSLPLRGNLRWCRQPPTCSCLATHPRPWHCWPSSPSLAATSR